MADLSDRLTAALVDRYRIEREIGRGGMAVVYLAADRRHQHKVALKVLRPELAASLGADRFLREIRTAAQLTHPNILPLHDSGEADGTLYYTMPFVEGESLRDRLNRVKQLPIEEALQITKEVADALGYAHEQGIIHRDIKPENILFQRGHALVADFGIARAVSAAGAETLTETGLAVGTPAYMSPEQGVGSGELDGRSDLYSLGCVLYEMLTGEAPYLGRTPQAIIAKKLSEPTPRVSVVRDKVPTAVEAVLHRALSRTPADRFATAEQFVEALSRETIQPETAKPRRRFGRVAAIVGVLVLAFIVLGAYGAWWFVTTGRPGTVFATGVMDPGDRVLLADFVNRTNDSALVYAVEEAIRADLSDPRLITLVDRAEVRATLQRMGLPPDTRLDDEAVAGEVAQRENARAFITGGLSQVRSAYQLTARVIASADGAELRSEKEIARNEEDLIDATGRLGEKLRRGIGESVRSVLGHPPLKQVTTGSLPALRAFSEAARLHDARLGEGDAIALLQQAVAHDSGFAMAHQFLAGLLSNEGRARESRAAAERAYRFRHRLPEFERLWVTVVYHDRLGNLEAADTAYRQAAALYPGNPLVLRNYADLRLSQRRWAEAEDLAAQALESENPGSMAYANAVEALLAQRKFAAAESTLAQMTRSGLPRWAQVKFRMVLARRAYDSAQAFNDSVVGATGQPVDRRDAWALPAIRGRLRAAARECPDRLLSLWRAYWAGNWMNDTVAAAQQLDRWFAGSGWDTTPPEDRAYQDVIPLLAEIGRVGDAKRLYAEWEDIGDAQAYFRSDHLRKLGAIAMAEGLYDSAATSFLRWHTAPFAGTSYRWNRGLVEAAAALDRLGDADSTVALFEQALQMPALSAMINDDFWYPLVLRRLGELHESLGHRDEAERYYSDFIDLWKDADPELQPHVEEARAALARLTSEAP